jgi:hypothetical protein
MFDSSQRLNPDTELPDLAAAIAGLPAPQPGRTGLATGMRVRALLTLRRRLDAHLLAEIDSFDAQGFSEAYGFPTTQSWLRAYGNLDQGIAGSMVASARVARRLPSLGEVLATGTIGVEHIAAVARSTRHVPEEVVAEHETALRNLAPHARPSDLARAGQKITEVYQHDAVEADRDYIGDARRLSLAQTIDGIWSLDGQLTPEDGAKLAAALEPLMRKRGPEDERTPTQRRVDALGDLVDVALRSGQLPQAGGDRTRITLLVHVTEQALAAAGHGDSGLDLEGADSQTDWDEEDWDEQAGSDDQAEEFDQMAAPDQTARDDQPPQRDDTSDDRNSVDDVAEQETIAVHESDVVDPSDLQPAALRLVDRDGEKGRQPSPGDIGDPGPRSPAGGLFAGSRLAAVFGDGGSSRQILGSTAAISDEALARIACDADINLARVGKDGTILHHGRSTRFAKTGQVRALIVRDGGCVFPGCDKPPGACQAHHVKFWTHLGHTDLPDLALVCRFHHWLIHDRHWLLECLPPDPAAPAGGWQATSPTGLVLRRIRKPAA